MKGGKLVAILFLLAGLVFMAAGALPALFGDRPSNVVFISIGCASAVLGVVFIAVSRTAPLPAKQ